MITEPDTPLVSIIIPCYNTEKYVGEALDSALAQTWPHCEIIAVNDGSTDNSRAILDRYAAQYPDRVRVIHQDNQGVSHTRMNGIMASHGEFILPLDADDRLHPDAVATWLAYQQTHPEFVLIYGPCYTIDAEGWRTGLRDFSIKRIGEPMEGVILPTLLIGNVITTCPFVRKDALLAAGGYVFDDLVRYAAERAPDEQTLKDWLHTEDYFLWMRMALQGYPFGYVPQPLFDYRDTPGSSNKQIQRVYDSQLTFIKYLTLHYPEQMAEAWFKGRYIRESHTGRAWTEVQTTSEIREREFADLERQLRETIAQSDTREQLTADLERQLRESIAQGQAREAQLAEFEHQLRETTEQSQHREKLFADIEHQLHESIAHGQDREAQLAEFESQVRDMTARSQAREQLLADLEAQLQAMIGQGKTREAQLADFEHQLREIIDHSQQRETLLADFESQLREMIDQSQNREQLLADLHAQLLTSQAEKDQLAAALAERDRIIATLSHLSLPLSD